MIQDRTRKSDGYLSMEGGVDAGFAPAILEPNQLSWAINTTFRGGFPTCRPGWIKRTIVHGSEGVQNAFRGYFQGAGSFTSPKGIPHIALSVSGRVFLINLANGYKVKEITIPGDPGNANSKHVWFQQAARWLIVQNKLERAFLYDGATSRRAVTGEVPIGGPMAQGQGRLWVARGNEYWGGDLIGSDPDYGQDTIIRFTENDFLNEGGGFAVDKEITGLGFAASLNTALGNGDLIVTTDDSAFAFDAPVDRDVWKNLTYPLQRFALIEFGSMNHESIVNVNGDLFFRSEDGVRSLAYAQRDFQSWGNTPISRQVGRATAWDTLQWLTAASAVNFHNRLLMTVAPQLDNAHGIWHRGLVALDFHNITGMGRKLQPAWEGVWTKNRILQVLTVRVGNVRHCYAICLGDCGDIELWEISRSAPFDFDGTDNQRISWVTESKAFTFGTPGDKKRLMTADQWIEGLQGQVDVDVKYSANSGKFWVPWSSYSQCAAYRDCTTPTDSCQYPYPYPYGTYFSVSQRIRNLKPQHRDRIGLPQPPDTVDPMTKGLHRDGFEFAVRMEIQGKLSLKRFRIVADVLQEDIYGDLSNAECVEAGSDECLAACEGVEGCDPSDFPALANPTCAPVDPGDDPDTDPPVPDPGDPDPDPDPEPEPPIIECIFDPEDPPGDPVPTPCDEGSIVGVPSTYVWGLLADQNPNELLTPESIACHMELFTAELQATIESYEGMGYEVSIASVRKWQYSPVSGVFYAMVRKSTCNPFDGIGDVLLSFSGIVYPIQLLCLKTP